MNEAESRARKLVAEVLGLPEESVGLDTELNVEPRWDSLSHAAILARLEDDFGLVLTAENVGSIKSVADISALLGDPR